MKADDSDPMRRWQSISDWYVEFAAMSGWEFLHPMVALTAWAGKQPFASQLYPGTSHEYLCVNLLPGCRTGSFDASCGPEYRRAYVGNRFQSTRLSRCSLNL